jgi:hypothetical protein
MKNIPALNKKVFLITLLIILLFLLFRVPFELPPDSGDIDFRPYWSSTYLFRNGDDFSSPEKMDEVERKLTGWDLPFTMIAWFFPTGNLILLPYTYFTFSRASFYWLITNIVGLFMSAVLIWPKTNKKIWIPLLTVFGFSMTLISLKYGQVNTMVLLGVVLFLTFYKKNQGFLAGTSLILTTIKPHLVILTLPLLILEMFKRKYWRILAGFVSALLVSSILLFFLNPEWPARFLYLISYGMATVRLTPTINGLFVFAGNYFLGKWLWIIFLASSILSLWFYRKKIGIRSLIDISPIGWSYDQMMLLIPILRILEWISEGTFYKFESIIMVCVLLIVNGISFYQRTLLVDDVWFFWLPMITGLLYGYASFQKYRISIKHNSKEES